MNETETHLISALVMVPPEVLGISDSNELEQCLVSIGVR